MINRNSASTWRRVAGALSLAAGVALAPLPTRAACKVNAVELPVKIVGSRPIAMLGLNGHQMPMLLDTGAFFSFLTEAAASQLELRTRSLPDGLRITGFTGAVNARLAKVAKVQLVGATIPDMEFIVGINEVGGGAMGVIGRNFLSHTDVEYDLAHGMVRLIVPVGDCDQANLAYWAGDTPVNVVPLARDRRNDRDTTIRVEIRVNGEKMKALLDTGAPETSLRLDSAENAGIKKADMAPGALVGGGGAGHARSWSARVETFELGGEKIQHNRMEVVDTDWTDEDMLIGLDYFLAHRILVSNSQKQLYATWNGGPVFVHNTAAQDAADAAAAASAANDTETSPTDADGLARRGAAFAARNDLVHALADFDRACALAPKDAGLFAGRARVHLAMAHPAEALKDFDEALRLDPGETSARIGRAAFRAAAAERDAALDDLRMLDTTLPPQAHLRAAMGRTYALLERPDDALRQWALWLAAHRHDGSRDDVLNERCWLRVTLNLELDRALEDCEAAVDDNPDAASHQDSLGWVRVRRAEYPKAIRAFDQAIALRADSPWSFYGRGLARLRQGDAAKAAADLATARTLQPDIDTQAKRHGMQAE
jgi:tetratricopeptide (TPR) repeat protein/predicted aspartyl protease